MISRTSGQMVNFFVITKCQNKWLKKIIYTSGYPWPSDTGTPAKVSLKDTHTHIDTHRETHTQS
jgi:hypothetical protein